jgi:hypothetical protein
MEVDRLCRVLYAKSIQTKFGPIVLLTLQDSTIQLVKVFLPRPYGIMFTRNNIHAINEKTVTHALKYKGTCLKSKAFMLDIV